MRGGWALAGAVMLVGIASVSSGAQGPARRELVIVDTDIGDDIDDAFALGLALSDRRVEVLGVTTAYGDTGLRARLATRFLKETGHGGVPVFAGRGSPVPAKQMTQAPWARGGAGGPDNYAAAVPFLRDTIEAHPGEITLIAIGPETNLGDLIQQYPATFRKLKRVVLMGGSVYAGYGDLGYKAPHGPDAEWNIKVDPAAAKLVFGAGVPLYVMPLDATQSKIDEVKRELLFREGTPLTDALALLYHEWSGGTGQVTPTAFDVVAVAYAIDPAVCPTKPMRLEVDDRGFTVPAEGKANVQVCLRVSEDRLFPMMMQRLLAPETGASR